MGNGTNNAKSMTDPSTENHPIEEPSTNELLDEYSLQDVQEAPSEELEISGIPIDEFEEPVAVKPDLPESQ